MGKSYVTMETVFCIICGSEKESGAILMDRGLRDKFENTTCTGPGLCQEHQKLFDDGFIALVGADPEKSGDPLPNGNLNPEEAHRTGEVAHLKRSVFHNIFNVPCPNGPMAFVEPEVISALRGMEPPESDLGEKS